MKARGKTRDILKLVGEIQLLVGSAKANQDNDRDRISHEVAQKQLEKAHELCIQIRSMYDPIED
ncbi:hypothetical protein NV379_02225 [Paenibacillus sp. N1-5-1-14]|uniref:hypothetical protein n=1 Tax=Paenibacillus radicibacter TaxID=2972488 RepID=UPI002159713E|nr:hypothetical protein [Paenibacillus radicibacter]MCR8641463.1 hypothetical protein [Paenibacillus radicibacter]